MLHNISDKKGLLDLQYNTLLLDPLLKQINRWIKTGRDKIVACQFTPHCRETDKLICRCFSNISTFFDSTATPIKCWYHSSEMLINN